MNAKLLTEFTLEQAQAAVDEQLSWIGGDALRALDELIGEPAEDVFRELPQRLVTHRIAQLTEPADDGADLCVGLVQSYGWRPADDDAPPVWQSSWKPVGPPRLVWIVRQVLPEALWQNNDQPNFAPTYATWMFWGFQDAKRLYDALYSYDLDVTADGPHQDSDEFDGRRGAILAS